MNLRKLSAVPSLAPKADASTEKMSSEPIATSETDLSAMVGAFENRFQRKKKEREVSTVTVSADTMQRQALMLETMATIRRSLVKVAKIDLGERFAFSMDFDDWQGWPRLLIKLVDPQVPNGDYPIFQVLAHDRLNRATIEITCPSIPKPERIYLNQPTDVARMPLVLKKCVRLFLDRVERAIVDAEHQATLEDEIRAHEAEDDQPEESKISGDLFTEDQFEEDFLDKLPSMAALEALSDSPAESGEE